MPKLRKPGKQFSVKPITSQKPSRNKISNPVAPPKGRAGPIKVKKAGQKPKKALTAKQKAKKVVKRFLKRPIYT